MSRPAKRSSAVALLLVLCGAVAVGLFALADEGPAIYDGPVRPVERGPLTISVSEAGAIEARDKAVLKCEVDERSTTITFIVEEGKFVEKGDIVVELDASVLQDELYEEQIDVTNTEAEFLAARENVEVVKNQARSDTLQAELALRFAREDLTNYENGEFPKLLMATENSVTLAKEEMEQARDTYEWSEKLYERKFLSGTELNRDRLAFQRSELDLQLAEAEVELLKDFTFKRQIAQLESDIEQAVLALERVQRKALADNAQAEAQLLARTKHLERQKVQLDDIEQQIRACTMRAPAPGMVVYATTGRDGRDDDEPLKVGREVRSQEELVHIPLATAKTARVNVHESALDKVRVGQSVTVRAHAVPSRSFRGRVERIAPLPDAQSRWMNPDLKVYETDIYLEGDVADLRTGMTCRAEILVEHYEDTLFVPVHAVVRIGMQPTVYVVEDGVLVPRPVEIGLDNNRMVRIVSGVEEGELVALAPPLHETEKSAAPVPEPEPTPEELAEEEPPADEVEAASDDGSS